MANPNKPGTPEWWMAKLEKKLADRQKVIAQPDRYYAGKHDLRFMSRKFRSNFAEMFFDACDNWMPLVVDSVQERMRVDGFRIGDKREGDKRVWKMWQSNNLDADSDVLTTEALITGEAFTLVWPRGDDSTPDIFVESPTQVTLATDPGNRRNRLAALKKWHDDDEWYWAELYLPDHVFRFKAKSKAISSGFSGATTWELDDDFPNRFGVVPVNAIGQRRRMLGDPISEITPLIGIQDKINKLTFDMMIAAEYAAFRQRWATGLDIPIDPQTKKAVEPFDAAVDRVWASKSKDTQFGEFGVTELSNYVDSIEQQVQHLTAQSRTPPHYVFLRGNMPSGESLRSAETGLVAKVNGRCRSHGEGWEETMRTALLMSGTRIRGAESMATQWHDAESRTESEHIDAVVKKLTLGVPLRQLWQDAGYSQEDIEGFRAMLREESEFRKLLTNARPPTVSPSDSTTSRLQPEAVGVSADDSAQ